MKILFNFELLGDACIDRQLLELMLDVKAQLSETLSIYSKEISDDGGMVVVTIIREELSMSYYDATESPVSPLIHDTLRNFDWEKLVERHAQAAFN